jgi:hypothetical protein
MEKEIEDWARSGVKEEAMWEKYYDLYSCLINEIVFDEGDDIVHDDDLREWLERKKENAEIKAENIYFEQEEEEERIREEKSKRKLKEKAQTKLRTTQEKSVSPNVDAHDFENGPKTEKAREQTKLHKEAIDDIL